MFLTNSLSFYKWSNLILYVIFFFTINSLNVKYDVDVPLCSSFLIYCGGSFWNIFLKKNSWNMIKWYDLIQSCEEKKKKWTEQVVQCTYLYLNEPWTLWRILVKMILRLLSHIWNCKKMYIHFRVYKLFFNLKI